MGYIVKMSFYEGNTLHEAGTPFVHDDKAYVEKCLADGNVVDENDESVQALVAERQAEAEAEAANAAHHESVQPGVEATPSVDSKSDESQGDVKTDEATASQPAQPAEQGAAPSSEVTALREELTPPATTAPAQQPSAEQLDKDFQQAGAVNSPSVPLQ